MADNDKLKQTAGQQWQAEVNLINAATWKDYTARVTALNNSKAAHDNFCSALDAISNSQTTAELQTLLNSYKAAYEEAALFILSNSKGGQLRASYFLRLAQEFDSHWDAVSKEFTDVTPADSQDRLREEIGNINEAVGYLRDLAKTARPASSASHNSLTAAIPFLKKYLWKQQAPSAPAPDPGIPMEPLNQDAGAAAAIAQAAADNPGNQILGSFAIKSPRSWGRSLCWLRLQSRCGILRHPVTTRKSRLVRLRTLPVAPWVG